MGALDPGDVYHVLELSEEFLLGNDSEFGCESGIIPKRRLVNREDSSDHQEERKGQKEVPALHKLIHVKADQLDLSFVEKVVVSQSGIIDLCNLLLPGSAQCMKDEKLLDVKSLNNNLEPLHAVGLYGSKEVLGLLLQKVGVMPLGQECLDSMEAGIYGILSHDLIYLVYCHPGERMGEASRKDVSCNFIRYLMELCGTVFVCLDAEDVKPFLVAATAGSRLGRSRLQVSRTKKLQLSQPKTSENDFKLQSGFHVFPPGLSGDIAPSSVTSAAVSSFDLTSRLSEGLHRCIVLTPVVCPPSKRYVEHEKNLEQQELPAIVRDWSAAYNLDLEKLPDKDLLLLLKCGKLQAHQAYLSLRRSFELRKEENKNKFYGLEETLRQDLKSLQFIFQDILKAYRNVVYRSEEAVLASNADTLKGNRMDASSNQSAEMIGLERKLCEFWTGRETGSPHSAPSLLFVGSEFYLVGTDNKVIPLSRDLGFMFVVQSVRLSESAAGPVLLQQELVARSVSKDGSWASFSFTVHSLEGDCPKGPIVTSRRVQVSGRFASPAHRNEQEFSCTVQIKLKEPSSAGMLTWMQSYDRGSIGCQGTGSTLPSAGTRSVSQYQDACKSHSAKVESMIKRELLPLVRESRRLEITSQGSLLKQLFQQEESVFVNNLRGQLSNARPDLPSLSITGCHFVSSTKTRSSSAKAPQDADDKLIVRYVSEEIEQARIRWKVAELAPMKTDVERAITDRSHVIVPRCSDAHTLIELDHNVERLTKVVAMRSGEVLVFVENTKDVSTSVYLCPKLGTDVTCASPMKVFPRLFHRIAVDETSMFVALYAREFSKISMYKFDEAFRNMDRSHTELQLLDYTGTDLTSMMFIPGKREMVLIDSESRVSIFQISQGMIKPRSVVLPGPPAKALVTTDGSCLLALYHGRVSDEDAQTGPAAESSDRLLEIHVYVLDDALTYVKTVQVDSEELCASKRMEFTIVSFESQMHLLAFNTEEGIRSKILDITTTSGGCRLREVRNAKTEPGDGSQKATTCPALDYISQVFEKYATSPPLLETKKDLSIQLVLGAGIQEQARQQCIDYVDSSLTSIERDRGKDFSNLDIDIRAEAFDNCFDEEDQLQGSRDDGNLRAVGDFTQTLVCLIPIQIARAEKNTLRPLSDGLQLPPNIDYADAVSLATVIRFGFYDAVLAQWQGPIKVISSMGKQSSGKSYLLNHLSGSLLDVAGGRCTDGVWMTLRPTHNCMYVLLDFEGLGSFERSEQEDMLLSILNAAVSNITIFNKKDFHLDKETEAVFQRFQNGVRLVKQDTKLFKGMFYMAIKDVDKDDVEDLKDEFVQKIQHMCSKSEENFLAKMYGGNVEIAAMPPFQKQEFHDSICAIQATVEELVAVQHNGGNLATDLKLVMAQICAKDWSPIDTKRAALKVDLLRKHFRTAIALGRLQGKDGDHLVDFDRQEAIPDLPVQLHGQSFEVPDTDLELSPYQDSQVVGNILEMLRLKFELPFLRTGTDDEVWHSNFDKFLLALADRRRIRVLDWLDRNTSEFQKDADVQTLRMKAVAMLAELKQTLSLCSCKCQICFLRCVLEKSHPSEHTCMGGHVCSQVCTYCSQESSGQHNDCTDASGHEGPHDCKTRSHTCGKQCHLFNISSHCNQVCALRPSHAGNHLCNTSQHMCNQTCSLPSCSMEGCNRKCASPDHFHALGSNKHLCGYEHACRGVCEQPGACQIVTELSKLARRFSGKRSLFEYEHASENKGIKKKCSSPIPIGQERHQGPHACHTEALHYCEARCQACGYICNLQSGHAGLHDTTHGHMRDVKFVSEQEEIDIVDRKYVWGESGMAEMCMMHCKAQGRGHIHLIKCGASEPGGTCAKDLYPDARHETREYGPDFKVPKDELTHAAYWRHMGFRDPCQEEDRIEFALCNHYCTSEDHEQPNSKRSFCMEKLWHDPVPPPAPDKLAKLHGYVTKDGHRFGCKHVTDTANHIIFVIDRSGSMSKDDIKPSMREFRNRHNNRLGCVYEAIYRFVRSRIKAQRFSSFEEDKVSVILFSEPGTAKIVMKRREIGELPVYELLNHFCTFIGTFYSDGLKLAASVMKEALVSLSDQHREPVVIFLSDGVNDDGASPLFLIEEMLQMDPRLVLHTILFGKKRVSNAMLQAMADSGKGQFQVSIDEVQLAKSFEGLANSLRAPVTALM